MKIDATREDLEAGKLLRHRGDNGLYYKDEDGYWVAGGDGNWGDESKRTRLLENEVDEMFAADDPYGFAFEPPVFIVHSKLTADDFK